VRWIELHIESLVLEGAKLDSARLTEAVRAELQRLLAVAEPRADSGRGSTGELGTNAHRRHGVESLGHAGVGSAERVGAEVARAVHGRLPR
jgi:hypothetical protein